MADLGGVLNPEACADWLARPIAYQMGNIGSEVSRALKWRERNPARSEKAVDRALELFDLTIEANLENHARLTEILKARDEFCDYFFANNSHHTDTSKMQKYYDGFAIMMLKSNNNRCVTDKITL